MRIHRSRPEEGVLLAEIDRPPVNAYDFELLDALEATVAEAVSDSRVGCIVLASHLPRIFSAGADLAAFLQLPAERRSDLCTRCRELQETVQAAPKPVLALIEGKCLGGGAEIALACDVRFMARGSARIGFPEVTLGLLPASGGTQTLPRLVGRGRALDLLLSGRLIDADEAREMGLVQHVADGSAIRGAAIRHATHLAALPAAAVAAIKDSVHRGLRSPLREGLVIEKEHVDQRFADPRTDEHLHRALGRPGGKEGGGR